jgi:hypothetical protein
MIRKKKLSRGLRPFAVATEQGTCPSAQPSASAKVVRPFFPNELRADARGLCEIVHGEHYIV